MAAAGDQICGFQDHARGGIRSIRGEGGAGGEGARGGRMSPAVPEVGGRKEETGAGGEELEAVAVSLRASPREGWREIEINSDNGNFVNNYK